MQNMYIYIAYNQSADKNLQNQFNFNLFDNSKWLII
jgi:hypothetical protein